MNLKELRVKEEYIETGAGITSLDTWEEIPSEELHKSSGTTVHMGAEQLEDYTHTNKKGSQNHMEVKDFFQCHRSDPEGKLHNSQESWIKLLLETMES